MKDLRPLIMQHCYEGPAGVHFTPDELLIIWSCLYRIPNAENSPIRKKIEHFLEQKGTPVSDRAA